MRHTQQLDSSSFPGWPSRDNKPILCIDKKAQDLSVFFGLKIFRERDNLGWNHLTYYIDSCIGPVVFISYDEDDQREAICFVDINADTSKAIETVKGTLGLDEAEISWERKDESNQ